jgi:hypothetical protein
VPRGDAIACVSGVTPLKNFVSDPYVFVTMRIRMHKPLVVVITKKPPACAGGFGSAREEGAYRLTVMLA